MYFFTSDEHYGHARIIELCNRPFKSIEDMDETLIQHHNEIVAKSDIVIHAGDFTLKNEKEAQKYIDRLNGNHIFLQGSHDSWMKTKKFPFKNQQILKKKIEEQHIVVCHYAMRVWEQSHYGSWMLYGHSHGKLPPLKNQWDIGVDNNDFYPVSFNKLKEILLIKDLLPEFPEGV